MQLVQLQNARERFEKQGIALAAISYDTPEILKEFSTRQHIAYPLLADPKSEIIRRYNVFNETAKGMTAGMAYPGYVFIAPDGTVKELFFETDYVNRHTANHIMARLFPELIEGAVRPVEAKHIGLNLYQSDAVASLGNVITLGAEISLDKEMHVYAPGVQGYKPIQLDIDPSSEYSVKEAKYPEPRIMNLPVIHESVPVFEGKFRITQELFFSSDRAFMQSVGQGKTLTVHGNLKYQACDQKICYEPETLPVSWEVHMVPIDLTRSPEAIRHK